MTGKNNKEMSGTKRAILDSNVIIEASKKMIDVESTLSPYSQLFISVVSYVEVIGFDFVNTEEKDFILTILSKFPIIDINKDIADIAVEYRKKKKIKLPDAFILATARYLEADLITNNVNDFKDLDDNVSIIVPTR